MYLRKGSLVVRNAVTQDAKILCEWWNDGAVMAHAGFPMGLNTTVAEIADKIKADTVLNRHLILEIGGIPVGEMSYRTVAEHTAAIGIKICERDRQEKGHGTVFLKMLIGYVFDRMGYQKIVLDTNVKNQRAQHVYEKIGFRKTGVRVDAWRDQMGQLQSFVDYELSREEYNGQK